MTINHTPSQRSGSSVASLDTPISVSSSSLTVMSSTADSPLAATWNAFITERSWIESSSWALYQSSHGLYEAKRSEVPRSRPNSRAIGTLLATVPYKKIRKFLSE